MKNKTLTCYAQDCINNDNLSCNAGSILIGGPSATTTSECRCKDYEKVENKTFNNKLEYSYGQSVDVRCTSKNCEYNNNRECKASQIKINYKTGSCETFLPNYRTM